MRTGNLREKAQTNTELGPGYLSKAVFLALGCLCALLLSVSAPAFAQEDERDTLVRFAHLSPDTPNIDVYVDDEPLGDLSGVSFKTVSPYVPMSAGEQNIKVYRAGEKSEPIIDTDVDLSEDTPYTIGAVGLMEKGSLTAAVYEDDTTAPTSGDIKLRAVHAVPDGADVDISTPDGTSLFTDLGFPNATKYVEVPAGKYALEARPAGEEAVAFTVPEGTFSGGAVYSAFVVGEAQTDEDLEMVVARYAEDTGDQQETATLPVLQRAAFTYSLGAGEAMPETGGTSPVAILLTSAVALLGSGLFVLRSRRD